jgi:probable selenate reductase FAD-binding subunit
VIETYHRPATLEQALSLLETEGTTVLGGGTSLVAAGGPSAVVDLQDLGLDSITLDGGRVWIGAMVRLRALVESDLVPAILRDLARREAPNTIRNAATVGGTVATRDPESELVAGLLVHEAEVTIVASGSTRSLAVSEYLHDGPSGIITQISLESGGEAAAARTGRTPADRPIVAAVARRGDDGGVRLALTGVASTPLLIDPSDVDDLVPPADFRGSTEYRGHLATVLTARAIAGLDV